MYRASLKILFFYFFIPQHLIKVIHPEYRTCSYPENTASIKGVSEGVRTSLGRVVVSPSETDNRSLLTMLTVQASTIRLSHLICSSCYLSISRLDGTVVMVSDSHDSGTNTLDELPIGIHRIRIAIPSRTLGAGEYSVYLNFTSRRGLKGFNIDSPGIVSSFRLDDSTTDRGNSRMGFFSTQLSWETK